MQARYGNAYSLSRNDQIMYVVSKTENPASRRATSDEANNQEREENDRNECGFAFSKTKPGFLFSAAGNE